MGLTKDGLTGRFAAAMAAVAGALGGTDPGLLGGDPAIARCAADPVPVLSAAMSVTAVRRAAQPRRGPALRLAVDARADPHADRRVPRGRRDSAVRARPAGLGGDRAPGSGRPADREVSELRAGRCPGALAGRAVGGRRATPVRSPRSWPRSWPEPASTHSTCALHVPGVSPATARDQIAAMGDVVTSLRRLATSP